MLPKRGIRWTKKQPEMCRKCGFIPEVCEEIESNDQIDTEFEELVRRIDGDASSSDYIGVDDMVPFAENPLT